MKRIREIIIGTDRKYRLTVPKKFEILRIGMQGYTISIWALYDTNQSPALYEIDIFVRLNYQEIEDDIKYIGTCRDENGIVYHLFYRDRDERV